jgi:limonene 1,2-monooxygenase
MSAGPISFGAFLSPLHPVGESPTLAMRRDMDLIEWLDELDFAEFWVGEHHSAGWGVISSPELFISAAFERTKHIRLGTGVVSLPYHNPFLVASRAVQLDHMSRGRFILGVGAGSLASDMHMFGTSPAETRARTTESAEIISQLLTSDEPVTRKSDWYDLRDARLQLKPYSREGIEIAISSASSPFGMKLAGKLGLSPLSFGAPRPGTSPSDLAAQWQHTEEEAALYGRTANRERWRIALPMHVAETREEALDQVFEGWRMYRKDYWGATLGLPVPQTVSDVDDRRSLEAAVASRSVLVGSVEDVIESVEQIREMTGGFGTILTIVQDWTTPAQMKRSFELVGRYVAPRFNGSLRGIESSQRWVAENNQSFLGQIMEGYRKEGVS